jgi:hypothetical protein
MKDVTKIIIHWSENKPEDDDLDMALEYIISQIKKGYTSGYPGGNILSWVLK